MPTASSSSAPAWSSLKKVEEVSASPDSKLVLTIAHGECRVPWLMLCIKVCWGPSCWLFTQVFRTSSGECIWMLDDEYILHACFAPSSTQVLVASCTQLRQLSSSCHCQQVHLQSLRAHAMSEHVLLCRGVLKQGPFQPLSQWLQFSFSLLLGPGLSPGLRT